MRKLFFLLLLLCNLFASSQTKPTLPEGAVLFSTNLFRDPLGNIWTGKTGNYVNLGSAAKVDSLIRLGYSNTQIDSIALVSRKRENHTGVQAIATVSGLQSSLDSKVNNSTTITGTGGIDVGGSLSSGSVSIGVNDTYLNNRYLRKDVNDENGNKTLTIGKLLSPEVETDALKLASLAPGSTADQILVVDGTGNVKKKPATSDVNIGVANSAGANQFSLGATDAIRFAGSGDASVSFNPSTKTVTVTSIPGSGTGGAVSSFNGRTGAVASEIGDYSTGQVPENASNLYFTEDRVRSTPLTGLSVTTNSAVTATDNVLQSIGKLQAQTSAKAPLLRSLTVSGVAGRTIASGGTQNLTNDREWSVDLATSGVTPGTYTKLEVDSYGRVIDGANVNVGDIMGLEGELNKYVTISTEQTISGKKLFVGGRTGGHWTNSNIEIQGGGGTDKYPSITFHQPGSEAKVFHMKNDGHMYLDNNRFWGSTDFGVTATESTGWAVVQRDQNGNVWGEQFVSTNPTLYDDSNSLMGTYQNSNTIVKLSKKGANRALGIPDNGDDLNSILNRGNSSTNAIFAGEFRLRYSDGGGYNGIKLMPNQITTEYWNSTTGGDAIMHRFTGNGKSLMSIDNYGRVTANDAISDNHLVTLRQVKGMFPENADFTILTTKSKTGSVSPNTGTYVGSIFNSTSQSYAWAYTGVNSLLRVGASVIIEGSYSVRLASNMSFSRFDVIGSGSSTNITVPYQNTSDHRNVLQVRHTLVRTSGTNVEITSEISNSTGNMGPDSWNSRSVVVNNITSNIGSSIVFNLRIQGGTGSGDAAQYTLGAVTATSKQSTYYHAD